MERLEPLAESYDRASEDGFLNRAINNAFNRHPHFVQFLDYPGVIEIAESLLGADCHVIAMTSWLTGPGRPDQPLHADYQALTLPEDVMADPRVRIPVYIATAHFYLDDLDEEIGPTRFIPGSHRAGRRPGDDTAWQGREEQSILCNAGDVVIFRSEVWHRGSANHSDRVRHLLQVSYSQRSIAQRFPPVPEPVPVRSGDPGDVQRAPAAPDGGSSTRELRLSFTLGVVTDEIDADPAVALPAAREMGLTHLEFNKVGERGVHELSADDVAELRRMVAGEGMQVAAVDPPSFKAIELDEVPVGRGHPARRGGRAPGADPAEPARWQARWAPASCACSRSGAATWPAPVTRRHGSRAAAPYRTTCCPRSSPGCVPRRPSLEEHRVTLGLENVRSCWGNSGHNAARILAAVDHPRLRAIWDPGNDFVSGGVPYPDGYRAILPYLLHVHVKDAAVVDDATGLTSWAPIGSGSVDYAGQVDALRRDGYDRRRERGDPLAQGRRLPPRVHPARPWPACASSCRRSPTGPGRGRCWRSW